LPKVKDESSEKAAIGSGQGTGEPVSPARVDPNGTPRPRLVVVLGMHRSGTSLCAHVLNALGVNMADEPVATPSNPKGHWERLEIVALHDRILDLFNRGYFDPLHDLPLAQGWWDDPRVAAIKRDIVAFFKPRLVPGMSIGFKDPRTARLLRLWQEILTELNVEVKFILCLRNPAEVARSLNHRDGLPLDMGEYRWFIYIAEIFDRLRDAELCTIEYEQWFDGKGENAAKLIRFLDLDTGKSLAAIAGSLSDIVDERLSHAGPAPRQPDLPLVRDLYEAVRGFGADPVARAKTVRIVDQFRAFQQLYEPMTREFEVLSQAVVLEPARSWKERAPLRQMAAVIQFALRWRRSRSAASGRRRSTIGSDSGNR